MLPGLGQGCPSWVFFLSPSCRSTPRSRPRPVWLVRSHRERQLGPQPRFPSLPCPTEEKQPSVSFSSEVSLIKAERQERVTGARGPTGRGRRGCRAPYWPGLVETLPGRGLTVAVLCPAGVPQGKARVSGPQQAHPPPAPALPRPAPRVCVKETEVPQGSRGQVWGHGSLGPGRGCGGCTRCLPAAAVQGDHRPREGLEGGMREETPGRWPPP